MDPNNMTARTFCSDDCSTPGLEQQPCKKNDCGEEEQYRVHRFWRYGCIVATAVALDLCMCLLMMMLRKNGAVVQLPCPDTRNDSGNAVSSIDPNSSSTFVNASEFMVDTPSPSSGWVNVQDDGGIALVARDTFNTWNGQRQGAPFAYVAAPKNSNHYSASVEMKLDNRDNGRQIGLFGIYDEIGSGVLSFHFGPRTWSGAGIGVQTDGWQDYTISNADLLEWSLNNSVNVTEWQMIRFTIKPTRLVDFEWFDAAGTKEWNMFHTDFPLASGYGGSSIHGKYIFVGLKTGTSDAAQLHVRNLVVTTYDHHENQ